MSSILKVDDIQDSGGNSIISSNGSGTFSNNLGISMTPAFYVTITSNQTVSDNVKTKVSWTNEVYDTDSAFASDKFTVPSGQAGKYNFYVHLTMGTSGSYGVLLSLIHI